MGAKKKVAIKINTSMKLKAAEKISNVEDENYLNEIITNLAKE